jgi:hypothetical protein
MRLPGIFTALPFIVILFVGSPLSGQAPGEVISFATITFSSGESITVGSNSQQVFNPVNALPGEALGVELRLPPDFVNTPVGIQPMDGGFAPEDIEIDQNGATAFVFQVGNQPGLYRVVLATLNSSVLLQFSVPSTGNR